MNKKFKIKSTNPDSIIDLIRQDFVHIGKKTGSNKIVIGAGIGLAVLNCSLNWEIKEDFILFSVTGSHGISGIGIVFVVLSILLGFVLPLSLGGILILIIVYYLEITQINQKISEGIDEIKFKFDFI